MLIGGSLDKGGSTRVTGWECDSCLLGETRNDSGDSLYSSEDMQRAGRPGIKAIPEAPPPPLIV